MVWHADTHLASTSSVARVETGDKEDNFSQVGYPLLLFYPLVHYHYAPTQGYLITLVVVPGWHFL